VTYTFSPPRPFTFAELRALPRERHVQVVRVLQLRDPDIVDLDGCERVLSEQFGIGAADTALDLYAIAPGLELWVYMGEAGIVVDAVTLDESVVFCQQRFFWSVDPEDRDAVQLASDLNACARW
jgi:hypothetical protein